MHMRLPSAINFITPFVSRRESWPSNSTQGNRQNTRALVNRNWGYETSLRIIAKAEVVRTVVWFLNFDKVISCTLNVFDKISGFWISSAIRHKSCDSRRAPSMAFSWHLTVCSEMCWQSGSRQYVELLVVEYGGMGFKHISLQRGNH